MFIDVYLHMVYYYIMKDKNRKDMKNISTLNQLELSDRAFYYWWGVAH